MSWEDILKEESVKELVEEALSLHRYAQHDFGKETYTKKDIKQLIDFFKKENKRDRLDEFELDYNSEAIKLLRQALRKLQ
tara:strand:+ start:31 stop:270 length:240 start_codon:yes stop_codon:yes gene_type:complete